MMAVLTPQEGLFQEETITARIPGRRHLIKEKEAKNYVGGGSKMATQAVPLSPQLAELPPKSADLLSLTMWLSCG